MTASTHRATNENGPNVVNRQLVWTSATGITVADHNSYGGCLRRWFIEQVLDLKGPPTAAMLGGTELHSEIENRLRRATPLQSPRALAGAHFIPQPGGNLSVERPIHFNTRSGVSIFGHVDLYNFRQEYIDEEGVLQRDPSWSFEVKDWKTTSDFQYAKTARDLAENIQLVTYAEAGYRFAPDMEHSRLTHVYFRTRGAPASKLVTVLRDRSQISTRWEYAESVVRTMSDAARETNVELIPGNRASCDAYRGCPHRATCSVYKYNSLDSLFNKIAGDHLAEKENQVGIIANTPGLMQQQGLPQAQAPVTQQQLAQEEQQMRAQVAQQQQQMPMANAQGPTNTGVDLLTVCHRLSQYGFGFPKLVGNAAQAYATASGQNVAPGFEFQGVMAPAGATRSLHTLPLSEVAHIYQIDGEIAAERARMQVPAFVQGPPPSPIPPPQNAGYPMGGQPQQPIAPPQQQMIVPQNIGTQNVGNQSFAGNLGAPISFLAPGAPQSMPQLAQQVPATPQAPVEEKPKRKRGRPASGTAPEAGAPPQAPQTAAAASTPTPSAPATQVTPAAGPTSASDAYYAASRVVAPDGTVVKDRLGTATAPQCAETEAGWGCVLVNARFADKQTKSLAGYVDYINEQLAKRYCVNADGSMGVQDVRCPPKDSILAYGGVWGAVRAVVKADPPPQGDYHLDTFMDPLNEAVADALRCVSAVKGWIYVRGVRA